MAESGTPTLERPSYATYQGAMDEHSVLRYVESYEGPQDSHFPGCVPIPMTPEQFADYEGGVEYWSRECATAWILRDGGAEHESPGGLLPALLTRISMERGSPIRCCGALRMVAVDGQGNTTEGMHPDQSVYMRPDAWTPSGEHTVVGVEPRPDVVLEVDHTTDTRRFRLDVYRRWGCPEVWIEVPDATSPSRPRGLLPGLTIHVLEDGAYREATESVALPTWQARDIHIALNETTTSADTIAGLVRVGRVLGDRDGTGPMDDAQVAGYMRRSHQVGQRTGFAQGHKQGRAEGVALAATELLRLRGILPSADFQRRLAAWPGDPPSILEAARLCSTEEDFWARLPA